MISHFLLHWKWFLFFFFFFLLCFSLSFVLFGYFYIWFLFLCSSLRPLFFISFYFIFFQAHSFGNSNAIRCRPLWDDGRRGNDCVSSNVRPACFPPFTVVHTSGISWEIRAHAHTLHWHAEPERNSPGEGDTLALPCLLIACCPPLSLWLFIVVSYNTRNEPQTLSPCAWP